MEHVSTDTALIPRPAPSHPPIPAPPGGYLLVASEFRQGRR